MFILPNFYWFFPFLLHFPQFFFIHATATRFTTMHSSVLPEQQTYLSYKPFQILRSHCYSSFVWFCVHRHCNKNKTFYHLRRYDTIKLVDEISLNFPELFIIGKYVKIRLKNRFWPCYYLSSRGQRIKYITKYEQKRLFLFTFLASFFMAFLGQKLI